ncbi:MAG: four helix bundle protein [Bacteroidota bacterium]
MKEQLIKRNRQLVFEVIDLIDDMPKSMVNSVFARQLIRSSSSVGANYRAACRAKSQADFINKLKIVEEELDESIYFMELIKYATKGKFDQVLNKLSEEAYELLSIYVASINTAKRNKNLKSKISKSKNP